MKQKKLKTHFSQPDLTKPNHDTAPTTEVNNTVDNWAKRSENSFLSGMDSPSCRSLLVSTTFLIALPGFLAARISWQLTQDLHWPKATSSTLGRVRLLSPTEPTDRWDSHVTKWEGKPHWVHSSHKPITLCLGHKHHYYILTFKGWQQNSQFLYVSRKISLHNN